MQFKDIKQNYPIFILDKQELTIIQARAVNVGFPRMEMNPKSGKSEMVIDITIDVNGKTGNYAIPENLSVTYAGNIVLSTTQQGLSNEIESLQNAANQFFASEGYQRKVLEKAPALLAELNPIYKEKQETEKRFSSIESSIGELKDMITGFIKEFKS